MKKLALVVLLVVTLIFVMSVSAYAVTLGDVEVMSENYSYANAGLTIDNGKATADGILQGIPGKTDKVTVHLYLQQYKNGEWVNCDDWLKSEEAASCSLSRTVTVTKGYKYRAKASCYAYAG